MEINKSKNKMKLNEKNIKKLLKYRLKREFNKVGVPLIYLLGYQVAIKDIYWELFNEVLITKIEKTLIEKFKKMKN